MFLLSGNQYKHIETKHYRLHFQGGDEVFANQVLKHLEPIHSQLENFFQEKMTERSHVLLDPNQSLFNGFNTMVPDNLSTLYLFPPNDEFFLNQYGPDWLYQLLLHELAHNVHLNRREGTYGVFRNIFGSEIGAFGRNPDSWNKEGIATYLESLFSPAGTGRLNQNRFQSIARYEAKLEQVPPIYDVNNAPGHWLINNTFYVYGSLFVRYIDERFGREKLVDFMKRSTSIFPLFKDIPFKKIYGKWPPGIWDEWYLEMIEEGKKRKFVYVPESNDPRENLLGEKVGLAPMSKPRPYFFQGNDLHSFEANRYRPLKLIQENFKKKKTKPLKRFYARAPGAKLVGVKANGDILYLSFKKKGEIRLQKDLYIWKGGSRFKQITKSGDVVLARHAEKANLTWVMRFVEGKQRLFLLNEFGDSLTTLDLTDQLSYISDLQVSADAQKLFIYGYDFDRKEQASLYSWNASVGINPKSEELKLPQGYKDSFAWNKDDSLTFTMADARGVDQVWQWPGSNGAVRQLTYSDFGAWAGKLNGEMFYFYVLSPNGFQLMRQPLSEIKEIEPIADFKQTGVLYNGIGETDAELSQFSTKRTLAFASGQPSCWLPTINLTAGTTRGVMGTAWLFGGLVTGYNLQGTMSYRIALDYAIGGNVASQSTFSYRFPFMTYQTDYVYLGDFVSPDDLHAWNNAFIFNQGAPFTEVGQFFFSYLTQWDGASWENELNVGLLGVGAKRVRRFSFFKEGWVYYLGAGMSKPWLISSHDVQWAQADIHYYQPLFRDFGLHFRLAWAHAWGNSPEEVFSIRSVTSLERYQFEYFSDDLDQVFRTRRLPVRIGWESQSFGAGGIVGLDFYFPVFDFYSVTKWPPWFLFQNISGNLFYEAVVLSDEDNKKLYAYEHGVGIAFDFRFNDDPLIKLNLGASLNFTREEEFVFINVVIGN